VFQFQRRHRLLHLVTTNPARLQASWQGTKPSDDTSIGLYDMIVKAPKPTRHNPRWPVDARCQGASQLPIPM
jgi:hypothetical protein